jgi:hypothetical protein
MIVTIRVENAAEVIDVVGNTWPAELHAGISRGIDEASHVVADDIAVVTPVQSGEARAGVTGGLRSELVGEAGWDAFYMRFVELGARAHPIISRSRIGSGIQRRVSRQLRRVAFGGRVNWRDIRTSDWLDFHYRVKQTQAKALSIRLGGGVTIYRGAVDHPGVKRRLILSSVLRSDEPKILTIIEDNMKKSVGEMGVSGDAGA